MNQTSDFPDTKSMYSEELCNMMQWCCDVCLNINHFQHALPSILSPQAHSVRYLLLHIAELLCYCSLPIHSVSERCQCLRLSPVCITLLSSLGSVQVVTMATSNTPLLLLLPLLPTQVCRASYDALHAASHQRITRWPNLVHHQCCCLQSASDSASAQLMTSQQDY